MGMCSNIKACEATKSALRCKDRANVEHAEETAKRIAALEAANTALIVQRDAAVADALRWRNIRTLDRDSVMKMVIEEGPFFRATDRDAYIDQFAARKEGQ